MLREAIRKSVAKFLFPQSYSTLLLPRTGYNFGKDVDGYSSSIIMACVGWIQRTFPEAPQVVVKRNADKEWEQIDHPLTDLMNNPNPFYDGLLLQQAFVADLVISGNAYMLKVRSGAGRPVQLWWTPSSLITPKWSSNGNEFISHYDYFPGGMAVRVDIKDVVHYRLGIDPNNLRKGRSPLQSLLREIFTDDEAANMTASLLKNMGVPGLVISPMQDSVSPQDADAVKAYVKERTTGDRRGEPIVIGSATKIDTFGFNPQQMDLRQLRQIPEERISAVLGVPAIVAGLGAGLARSTFSNMQEAREMAYESGIIPLQRIVASQTSHQLLSEYTDDLQNYRVAYDTSEIRVLQDDEDKLSARTVAQVNGGVCKVTDAQRILGLPVDDSQDFYLRSYSATPVRSGEEAPEEPPPAELPAKSLKSSDWSEEQKAAHWKRIDRERLTWAGLAQKKVAPLYEAEAKAVVKAVEAGGKPDKAIQSLKKQWTDSLVRLTENIVEHFGKEPTKAFTTSSRLVQEWIKKHAGESVTSILATNLDDVNAIILEGTVNELSATQIAKSLREFYLDRSPYKAMRVARTEVAQAAGFAQHESAKEAGWTKHSWLSSRDDRVRDSHQEIDGEEQPIGEPYSNGLMFPGDPSGDPDETIMCRCVERFY
jgi:HK97 family phage portal protein